MRASLHLVTLVSLIAAMWSPLAMAGPAIYDATGAEIGTPLGQDDAGFLSAYVFVNGTWVTLQFYGWDQRTTDLDFITETAKPLYFRSSDCSGPALITNDGLGTRPLVLRKEKHHAWLHLAEDTTAIGLVSTNSVIQSHKECQAYQAQIIAWKAAPAIDLYTLYKLPFTLR